MDSGNSFPITRLYVAGLPWSFKESDIRDIFSSVGVVHDIYMMKDDQGRFSGVAFVKMDNSLFAMKALNQANIGGRVISVRPAKDTRGKHKNKDVVKQEKPTVEEPISTVDDSLEFADESFFNSERFNTVG